MNKQLVKTLLEWTGETRSYWGINFDVNKAEEIIKKDPRETQYINVKQWAEFYGYTKKDDPKKISLMRLDREYAKKKSDADKPGIMAQIVGEHILIDGNHRLYKRYIAGDKTMEVYVLTPEESEEVVINKSMLDILKDAEKRVKAKEKKK